MSDCPLCGEPVADTDESTPLNTEQGRLAAHRECMLREVAGGIGHHIAHAYWCEQRHDPDAGLTRRQSALLVDAYVTVVGVGAVRP